MRYKLYPLGHRSRQSSWALTIISASVLLSGLITIASVLFAQSHLRRVRVVSADVDVTILVGLSLVYLSTLLKRGKYTAWLIAQPLYIYILVRNIRHFVFDLPNDAANILPAFLNLLVPAVALYGLVFYRHLFNVRSELRNFTQALRRAILILLVAFLYGVIGFQLMDTSDFHQEIPPLTGAHYTVDQFGLTTAQQLKPYTKRASLFLDSLGFISVGSLFYVVIGLFSPIRYRLSSRGPELERMQALLKKYPSSSEDFFKLWPRDKAYFFHSSSPAGLAYKVVGGTALIVGDPAGLRSDFRSLLSQFLQYCRVNDWDPALIHTESTHLKLYSGLGFESQKIGEEAIIDLEHFTKKVATNKYFRHVNKRFESLKYRCEVLEPPHSQIIIKRLGEISQDWLKVPGRTERGFMLGYFNEAYLQQCPIIVARDEHDTIQAFINQTPLAFNRSEANFDLLRHAQDSPGNINDFLLLNFIRYLSKQRFKTLNMGLAPLSGFQAEDDGDHSAIDNILALVYATGNRFYSFKGLQRFKSKYEPRWQSRYIVYMGGLRGFTRTMNSLMRAMRL